MADVNPQTLPYTLSEALIIPVFNPAFSPMTCGPVASGPIYSGTTGMCQITNMAGGANKLKIYDGSGTLWRSLKITKNILTGMVSATVPAGLAKLNGSPCSVLSTRCYQMPPGKYYAVLQTTYPFHSQLRTWYQIFGFTVS